MIEVAHSTVNKTHDSGVSNYKKYSTHTYSHTGTRTYTEISR